jgi:hypothetical protein
VPWSAVDIERSRPVSCAEQRVPKFASKIALALALVLTGVAVPIGIAASNAEAASESADVSVDSAVAAIAQAVATGERVEDLFQRTELTRVFANPDGTWTQDTAAQPERMRDADGDWHDLDSTLVRAGDGFAPRYALTDVVISGGGDEDFAKLTEDGHTVSFSWDSPLPTPVINDDTAIYEDVAPGQDLVVTATPGGFEHSLVLKAPVDGPVDFTTGVSVDGARIAETPAGGVVVKALDGDVIANIEQPLVYDSAEGDGTRETVAVDAELSGSAAKGQELTVTAEEAFLADPDTEYPVTIDPNVYVTDWDTNDVWIQNNGLKNNPATELRVGTNDGGTTVARTYLRFGEQIWAGRKVIDTDLVMYNNFSKLCNPHQINASRITVSWNPGTINWTNKPAGGGEVVGYTPVYGGADGTCGSGGYAHWDVDGIVQAWADGAPNYGIRLLAYSENNNSGYRKYYSDNQSASPTSAPHINVTYNSYPETPTNLAISQYASLPAASSPTFSAFVKDDDGGMAFARFKVYSGSNPVWTGDGTSVANAATGGSSTVSVPAGVLSDGVSYTVKAYGSDGTLLSGMNATSGGYAVRGFAVGAIAFGGAVTGLSNLDSVAIKVTAQLDEAAADGYGIGDVAPSFVVSDSAIRREGNKYFVVLEPSALPSNYLDSTGLVTFDIAIESGDLVGATTLAVRSAAAVDPALSGWVNTFAPDIQPIDLSEPQSGPDVEADPTDDPLNTDEDEASEPTEFEIGQSFVSPVQTATSTPQVPESGDMTVVDVTDGGISPKVSSTNVDCGKILDRKVTPVTIGTTYPAGGSSAWMRIGAEQTVKLGVATKMTYSQPYKEQKKAKKDIKFKVSYSYPHTVDHRSYRIEVEYRKVQMCSTSGWAYTQWEPHKSTGVGLKTHKLYEPTPTWNRGCGEVEAGGTWTRYVEGRSTGLAYALATAVKISERIGIDLSIVKPYTKSAQMTYHIGSIGIHEICGKDDYPAYASKVRERLVPGSY